MKIIFSLLISVTCFAQQPAVVDPILVQHWPDVTLVKPELRKVYKVLLRKDHAIYAENLPDSVWVTICYGCVLQAPTEPPVVQVDTVDSEGLTFSTDWQRKGLPLRAGWYKGTIAYSSVGQVSHKFTGTRLQIYGETKPTDGTGSIVIGSKTATIFYNKPQALQTLVYDSGVMPSGEYTFVLRPLLGSINLDFIVVHK